MKTYFLALCGLMSLVLSLPLALAEEPVTSTLGGETVQGLDLDKERQIIREKRQAADAEYKAALKLCYKKFAVNSCKQDALEKKMPLDNELRRQELILNNAARQQRGDKAFLRNEEKQSPEQQQQLEQDRIEKKNTFVDKLNENLDKNEKHLIKQQEIESNREKNQQRIEQVLERQRQHTEKAAQAEKNRADYQRKQDEAQKHKQNAAKDLADQSKTAKPLPMPKASEISP